MGSLTCQSAPKLRTLWASLKRPWAHMLMCCCGISKTAFADTFPKKGHASYGNRGFWSPPFLEPHIWTATQMVPWFSTKWQASRPCDSDARAGSHGKCGCQSTNARSRQDDCRGSASPGKGVKREPSHAILRVRKDGTHWMLIHL